MIELTNKFGTGTLAEEHDLRGSIYVHCTGCLSLFAEALSWANGCFALDPARCRVAPDADSADNVVVLGCQVTDLAVLNDLRTLESLAQKHPSAKFWASGCLARRFDIPLPPGVRRLENLRRNGIFLSNRSLVGWSAPFWLKEFDETPGDPLNPGHLFRHDYPLRIGVGCQQNCAYCTIRETRGTCHQLPSDSEFDMAASTMRMDVTLVSESPTVPQLRHWIRKALEAGARISLRNVEPHVALSAAQDIEKIHRAGLLKVLHAPIQSDNPEALREMGRPVAATLEFLKWIRGAFDGSTLLATNVILAYEKLPDPDMARLRTIFHVVNWNPYWNGAWNREEAERRFVRFLG